MKWRDSTSDHSATKSQFCSARTMILTLVVYVTFVFASLSLVTGDEGGTEGLREFLKRRQMERKTNFALGQKSPGAFEVLGRGSTPITDVITSIGARSVAPPFVYKPRDSQQLSRSKTSPKRPFSDKPGSVDNKNASAVIEPAAASASLSTSVDGGTNRSPGSRYRQRLTSKLSGFLKHREEVRRLDSIAPTAGEVIRQRAQFIPGIRYRASRPSFANGKSARTSATTTTTTTVTAAPTTTTTTTRPSTTTVPAEKETTLLAELNLEESNYYTGSTVATPAADNSKPATTTLTTTLETETITDQLTTTPYSKIPDGKENQAVPNDQPASSAEILIKYPLEVEVPSIPEAVTREPVVVQPKTTPIMAVTEAADLTMTTDNDVLGETNDISRRFDPTGVEYPDLGLASSDIDAAAVAGERRGRAFEDYVSIDELPELRQPEPSDRRRFTSALVDDNPYLPKLIYLGDTSRLEKENDVDAQQSVQGSSSDYSDYGGIFQSRHQALLPRKVMDETAEKSTFIQAKQSTNKPSETNNEKNPADSTILRSLTIPSRIGKPVDEDDTPRPVFQGGKKPSAVAVGDSDQVAKSLPKADSAAVLPVMTVKDAAINTENNVFTVIATSASTPSTSARVTPTSPSGSSKFPEALQKLAKIRVGPSKKPGTKADFGGDAFLAKVNAKNPKSISQVSLTRSKANAGTANSFSLSVIPAHNQHAEHDNKLVQAVNMASQAGLIRIGGYSKVVVQ